MSDTFFNVKNFLADLESYQKEDEKPAVTAKVKVLDTSPSPHTATVASQAPKIPGANTPAAKEVTDIDTLNAEFSKFSEQLRSFIGVMVSSELDPSDHKCVTDTLQLEDMVSKIINTISSERAVARDAARSTLHNLLDARTRIILSGQWAMSAHRSALSISVLRMTQMLAYEMHTIYVAEVATGGPLKSYSEIAPGALELRVSVDPPSVDETVAPMLAIIRLICRNEIEKVYEHDGSISRLTAIADLLDSASAELEYELDKLLMLNEEAPAGDDD